MKHKILILTSIAAICTHGMEVPLPDMQVSLLEITPNQSLSMMFNGTKVNVIQESICNPSQPVNLTVVGYNQQQILLGHNEQFAQNMGKILPPYTIHFICEKTENNDNASQLKKNIVASKIIAIKEPFILTDENDFIYQIRKTYQNKEFIHQIKEQKTLYPKEEYSDCYAEITYDKNEVFIDYIFQSDAALKQALSDLALCYTNCLKYGRPKFSFEDLCLQKKLQNIYVKPKIAFPILGIGFPQDKAALIAIETIIDFIQNDYNRSIQEDNWHTPVKYKSINLCVGNDSYFKLCSKLLLQYYYKPTYLIFLLYHAHKDQNSPFSSLLPEIINIITRIMALMG